MNPYKNQGENHGNGKKIGKKRNYFLSIRVSGRERGGEIPMRLKLTAAGWIPDRESEKGSAAVCEGREEYRNNNIREFYISKLYEAAGTESVPAVGIIL